MKKQLLGTTALAAAGLLAYGGAIQEASAAEPLTVSVGGYLNWTVDYWDQEQTRPGGLRNYAFSTDGEVQVSAKTTLDNGIKVGARIEYEAHNQGGGSTIVDEHYITFEGGFGQLRLGNDDNAAYQVHYQAPVASWRYGVSSPTYAILSGNGNAADSFIGTYADRGSDGTKLIYFTPRISGVQLAASYQPDGAVQEGIATNGNADGNAGQQSEIFSVGANILRDFEGGNIAASVGYQTANLEGLGQGATTTGLKDETHWTFGVTVGFGDIAAGFSYDNNDKSNLASATTPASADADTFDIGFTHSIGALTWGVNYALQDAEVVGASDDEVDAVSITFNYNIGPGVALSGGVKYYDYSSDTPAATPNGLTAGIGALVSF